MKIYRNTVILVLCCEIMPDQSKLKFDHILIYSKSILRSELVGMEPKTKLLTLTIKKLETFLFILTMVHNILSEDPLEIDFFF